MKYIIWMQILISISFADLSNINFFEADFKQEITDEKGKKIVYSGHLQSSKPQYALWKYETPVKKEIYLSSHKIVIIEPEIEQVIERSLNGDFDFFSIVKNSKLIKANTYLAIYKNSKFKIQTENSNIKSISYNDEFDNYVKVIFSKQVKNKRIDLAIFSPTIPDEYDLIKD